MLENHESFIYIKNDDEVNFKTDRFNTEPNIKNSFNNIYYDLSDSHIISIHTELMQKDSDLVNKNNLDQNPNGISTNTFSKSNLLQNKNLQTALFSEGNNNKSEQQLLLRNSKIKKTYIEEEGPKIISLENVPNYRKLFIQVHPFILHGYRIHHEISDCLFSVFKLHNETLNIWSHLIPFIGFLSLLINLLATQKFDLKTGGLIYLFVFFTVILFLFSSVYHILNCHSNEVCACCYKLDLMGIMFELIAATIASLFFMFHDYEMIKTLYIYLFLIVGVLTIVLSLFDYFISAKLNLFLMLLYASLFLMSFLSCVHWSIIANINEVRIISKYVLSGYLSLFGGFIFFFAKFPECIVQSKIVDYFFQSHTLWHISTSLCIIFYYLMLTNYHHMLYEESHLK